jgi:putative nucleotidyltransferase with HDIG domain
MARLFAVNFVALRTLAATSFCEALHHRREMLRLLALTVALTLAIFGVYARYGEAAGLFVTLIIVAFTYMSRLVIVARQRTGQYASLSWGVLSALVRSLDRRDGRTARHSAAVAAFARDIALECAMGTRDTELAHTAGLLHDIGRLACDRVMERDGTLTEDGLGGDLSASRARRRSAQGSRRLRPGRSDRPRPPRARRRPRLPRPAQGRRDPADRADRRGRRGL